MTCKKTRNRKEEKVMDDSDENGEANVEGEKEEDREDKGGR